jgi:hypothetical protein
MQATTLIFFRHLGGVVAVDPAWPCRLRQGSELRAAAVMLGEICEVLLNEEWRMACRITGEYLGKPAEESKEATS